jgi:hypothetical protein
MYRTSEGNRILLGAERRLFETCLGMIVDMLDDDDVDFGFEAFDNLRRNQKLAALYIAARGLLRPDEPPPKLTAFLEATVATVYQFAKEQVEQEIVFPLTDGEDDGEDEGEGEGTAWRRLVLNAAREHSASELPDEHCDETDEWDYVIDGLADRVLWDQDYALLQCLDATPEKRREAQETLGVAADYFTEIPPDPPDSQTNLYLDALRGLTASVR